MLTTQISPQPFKPVGRLQTALIGSGWDATPGPDDTLPRHLARWVQESAVAPQLAAANVLTLQGWPVLEALAGIRLETLGGHASQYATAPAARLLAPLETLAAAGGWWCSGLDPLADWAPMAWGCFRPDAPRWDPAKGKPRKYEHPIGCPSRSFWLRVPAVVAQLVADRFRLALPPEVAADGDGSAGAFWRWWQQTPALPLLLTEGGPKAGALLSIGLPAVALPGIWNGCPRTGPKDPHTGRRTGPHELLADLAGVPLRNRPCWVLFDHSDRPDPDEPRAARRLGRLLAAAGAVVRVGIVPGTHGKGADDHLAAGGSWEALAAALKPLGPDPVLPALRPFDLIAPAGQHLAAAVDLEALAAAPLLLVAAPMGTGKTRLAAELMAPHLAVGVPGIAPTHRTALGESQSEAIGLPWAAAPATDARLQGLGLCWDSLRPSSALAIRPEEWRGPDGRGPVVLLDEVAQGIEHLLFSTGTAVAQHRPETMATAATLLRLARTAIGMDGQLPAPVLTLLEALTGHRATLLGSEAQPMAGRPVLVPQGLTARTAAEQGRAKVLELVKARRRAFIVTTAQKHNTKGAAANLATLARRHWPEARILLIDSEHPEAAETLGRDPNGTAAAHDLVICSPSITSGLSIDRPSLFDEVVVIGAGGRLTCEHLCQAAARVRDPACPVSIYAPSIAPQLRIGSGDTSPAALLQHLARSEAYLLADLVAPAGWDPAKTNESPWLRCWLEMAAIRNRQSFAYACTVAGLLRREGWAVQDPAGLPSSPLTAQAAAELDDIAAAATAAADAAVIAAPLPTDAEAAELERRRRLSPAERAQRQRHRIARRWGLDADAPTPQILDADRQGLARPLRFRWLLEQTDRRELVAIHDRQRLAQLAPAGNAWAPDLVRQLLRHKLDAAEALGLSQWLQQAGEWISDSDARLRDLQLQALACRGDLRANLGISPGKRASGTLRALAGLIGCELEARRHRCGKGERRWSYRLVPLALPAGVDPARLEAAWRHQLTNPA